MKSAQSHKRYLRSIHKVQDYIEENLHTPFVLSELAEVAGFSKYHFHRIFSSITNETLLQYINRIKLERAAAFLIYRTELSITDIAYFFGFSDSAVFSRTFKNNYDNRPKEYRNQKIKLARFAKTHPIY